MAAGLIICKDPVGGGAVSLGPSARRRSQQQPVKPRLHQHRQDFNNWQRRGDKLIKNDHNETGLLWDHTCPLCECVCTFVVGIHQGLGVKGQLHPRLMTLQTDWPLGGGGGGGLTAGGGRSTLDRPGRGDRMGKGGKGGIRGGEISDRRRWRKEWGGI